MKKRPALGRGIDVLFHEYEQEAEQETGDESRIRFLDVGLIDPNRDQPRKRFDQERLEQLAQSIREVGVLQPLLVAERNGRYQIIAGERRWRAARLAGLDQVPCVVREAEQLQRMQIALVENLQRDDLNPVETAMALQGLITQCAITQEEAAAKVGKSRPAVANLLRLLALPKELLDMVAQGSLSEGHARALLGLPEEASQLRLAKRVVDEGLSVRQTEALVRLQREGSEKKKPTEAPRLAELGLLEEAARKALGVRATASGSSTRGKLILHYNSPEELERLYEALHGWELQE